MKHLIFLGISLIVFFCDQITKMLVVKSVSLNESINIIPGFLDLTLVHNYGVAFGLFARLPDNYRNIALFIVVGLAIILVINLYLFTYKFDIVAQFAISLIAGGAVGNIYDRFYHGAVIDFIDFYYRAWRWPAFNLADSCICIGICILLVKPTK